MEREVLVHVDLAGQPVHQAEHEQHLGVDPHRDAGRALLDLGEGHPADRGALGEHRDRDPPAQPRRTQLPPEPAQPMLHRQRPGRGEATFRHVLTNTIKIEIDYRDNDPDRKSYERTSSSGWFDGFTRRF